MYAEGYMVFCVFLLSCIQCYTVYFNEILMGVGSRAADPLYIIGKRNLTCRGAQGPRQGPECLPLSLLLCHHFPSMDLLHSSLVQTPTQTTHSFLSLPFTPSAPIPNSQGRALIGSVWISCPLDLISCGLGREHPQV